MWTCSLDGAVGAAAFFIIAGTGQGILIVKKFGLGVVTGKPEYQAQFRVHKQQTAEQSSIFLQHKDRMKLLME